MEDERCELCDLRATVRLKYPIRKVRGFDTFVLSLCSIHKKRGDELAGKLIRFYEPDGGWYMRQTVQ